MKGKLASIAAGLIFLFSLSFCRNGDKKSALTSYLNHSDSVKYLGVEACRDCHADKFETFTQTGMGKSFKLASREKTSAQFDSVKPIYDKYLNLYYIPFLSNDAIFVKEYRLDGKDTIYSRVEKINYIVGSGHHTNSHMISENGYLFQAPITFYTQEGKWDLPPGFENGNNSRFSRKIGLECMSCHNAMPKLVIGSENKYLDLPHGIDCERCHGPGELHVREMKNGHGVNVSKEIDYTIVNPGKLSWNRQIDVCQRCHLQGNAVLKPGKNFTDFKPGMVLSDVFDQFSPQYDGGDNFVMAAHAERFQQSQCFLQSVQGNLNASDAKLGFTCISCHNPHVSVKQTEHLQFNKTCVNCHQNKTLKQCSESIEKRQIKEDDCVFCHMPSSGTSDIPHVTVHDHYIRKPQNQSLKTGRLLGLRCITSKNPDIATETEAYISYFEKFEKNQLYLKQAELKSKKLNPKNTEHLKILIHLYYTQNAFAKIINLSENYQVPMDAWTLYRVAKAYEVNKKWTNAEKYMFQALGIETENLEFILQYSLLQIKQEKWKQAEKQLLHYVEKYSKNADAWAYLGLINLNKSELALAKKYFDLALNLDPDQNLALQNMKSLYALLGDKKNEMLIQKRILKLKL